MPSSTATERPSPPTIAATCNDVRHAVYLGGYCAAKSPLNPEPLPLIVPNEPLRQTMGRILMMSDHASFLIGSGEFFF